MFRILPLLMVPYAVPVLAGDNVLYRCLDAAGNPAFTNSRQGFGDCSVVARYAKPAGSPASPQVQAITPRSEPSPAAAGQAPAASSAAAASSGNAGANRVRRGSVYRYDNAGVVHYTNVRPEPSKSAQVVFTYAIDTCIACEVTSSVDWGNVVLRLEPYRAEIAAAVAAHGVDEALVRAIIHAESAYRVNARSHKGAQGLMQLMPATAARFGVTDAYDPAQNIAGGVRYLAFLLDRFGGDITLAAAGYNAGEGAVGRHGGVPPFAETQVYVRRVGILHQRYRDALNAMVSSPPEAAIVAGASP